MIKGYEMVIGLEVHTELATKTKIFCSCKTDFGAEPNTQCCPVCMGMPGTLPVLNGQVVEYAVKVGMATDCTIQKNSKQDRKNYFYPDLPKAYQISQYDLPLCENGHVDIETKDGTKRIGITRIHIEEDAGKLVHDDKYGTMIDCNRCGVPLIEIVSEPDIRSAEEAVAYLQKLRATIIYTGVSECRMQEGAFRCDVNLSVRKAGEPFGTRTEMKNLNSFAFIAKAIEYEYKRQIDAIESGETIVQETRRFDADSGKTFSMRKKENANDYRYFPDPDLPLITLDEATLEKYRSEIPTLPHERKKSYVDNYSLDGATAELIVTDKARADYFEELAPLCKNPKNAANLLTVEVLRLVQDDEEIAISPNALAEISNMFADEVINSNTVKKVIKAVFETAVSPSEYVEQNNLCQINDDVAIEKLVDEILADNQKSAQDYKNGKTNALAALIGQAMKRSGARANPVKLNEIMLARLNNPS